jgi:hypothetical protein
MATAETLRQKAKQCGATVERSPAGRTERYNVEAPPGKVWAATGDTHCLVVEWYAADKVGRDQAIADALDRMQEGLADCENEDCEYCHP